MRCPECVSMTPQNHSYNCPHHPYRSGKYQTASDDAYLQELPPANLRFEPRPSAGVRGIKWLMGNVQGKDAMKELRKLLRNGDA